MLLLRHFAAPSCAQKDFEKFLIHPYLSTLLRNSYEISEKIKTSVTSKLIEITRRCPKAV